METAVSSRIKFGPMDPKLRDSLVKGEGIGVGVEEEEESQVRSRELIAAGGSWQKRKEVDEVRWE